MYVIEQKLYDNIKSEMQSVLSKYTWKTDEALDSILKGWLKAKTPLLEMFSKHPNWNPEKLMIQFDVDFSREFNRNAINEFRLYLRDNAVKKHHVCSTYGLPRDEIIALDFIYDIRSQFFNERMDYSIDLLNSKNDNFKIRNNMKASKAIGKICSVLEWDKFPDYNKKYAVLCDAINPIKVKRHTCISLNPIDFLLMSNGNSWTSCHRISYMNGDTGCYSSGTISYMLDANSFLFYTVDTSFDGKDIELEPKLQRQIFGYKSNTLLQSRLYPAKNDSGSEELYTDIREIVQKVIADCLDIPNLWVKTKNSDMSKHVRRGNNSTAYPDYHYGNSRHVCTVTVHKSAIEEQKPLKMIIMGKQPICIKCGQKHENTSKLYCRKCSPGYY